MYETKTSYAKTKRIKPVNLLISTLEALLSLLGVLLLILYFSTGSFAGAGQKMDAGIGAIKAVVGPWIPSPNTSTDKLKA
jgi:hypothetical protein